MERGVVISLEGARDVAFQGGHVPEVVQDLRGCNTAFEEVVELQRLVEVRLRTCELTPVGVQDASVGQKPRLVQTVTGTAKQREGPAAVVECLLEPADADVDEGALHENLPAQLLGGPCGRPVELDQRRGRVAALQQGQDEAQARLDRAKVQLPRLGDGDGTSEAASRGAQLAGLTSHEADSAVGDRRCLRINPWVREHFQRGRLGPERIVSDRSQGTFGRVERRVGS